MVVDLDAALGAGLKLRAGVDRCVIIEDDQAVIYDRSSLAVEHTRKAERFAGIDVIESTRPSA